MPAMYEELQLALWKLGLDRVPEKYTLQDLEATFRYQSPLEYFVLRLLEEEMNLLDAVSAIYSVIAPPRPIMAQVQILASGFRSITELRQEIDRMIKKLCLVWKRLLLSCTRVACWAGWRDGTGQGCGNAPER